MSMLLVVFRVDEALCTSFCMYDVWDSRVVRIGFRGGGGGGRGGVRDRWRWCWC